MNNKIAVIGVGKLGICFALNLERAGYEVYGIEANRPYLESLQNRSFRSSEPEVDELLDSATDLHLTDNISCIAEHDIRDVFVMVATPSLPDGGYDHSQVERVAEKLKDISGNGALRHIYVGCTTMPGYCDELAEKLAPFGYTISYNPEFIAQGDIIKNQLAPDQVLIGEHDSEVGDRLESIYRKMVVNNPTYCRMDPLSAEIAKLATNCFLTTKISFANSIGDLALKAGADPESILAAVGADSRIGKKYLGYGFGFGGPCFPRDNRALGLFGNRTGYPLRLSMATDQVNDEHFAFQLQYWNEKYPVGEEVMFDGVAYKKGTSQITESQQLRLAVALAQGGRKVVIRDSNEVIEQVETLYPGLFQFDEMPDEVEGS